MCIAPSCTGTRRNTPGTCDGLGTCRPQGVQNCSPFLCATARARRSALTDADCESGHACVGGQCGKKNWPAVRGRRRVRLEPLRRRRVLRRRLRGRAAGAARSRRRWALHAARRGRRRSARRLHRPGRDDLRRRTARCDGSGGCQKYKMGTVCAPETCVGQRLHAAVDVQRDGPVRAARLAAVRARTSATARRASTPARSTATASRPTSATATRAARRCAAPPAPTASECSSTFCAQGVCCDTACAGACKSCALTGTLGTCTNVADGRARSRRPLRRPGRRELRHERQVPGGRVPEVRAGHAVQGLDLPRGDDDVHARLDLRRPGRVRDAGGELVLPVPVRRGRLQGRLHGRRRLRGARRVHERLVRPQGHRQDLRRRHRVPVEVLRAGRLLQRGVQRHLPVVRALGRARPCTQRRRRRRRPAAARCVDQGAATLRHRRRVRRQGRLPPLRRGHACAAAVVPRERVDAHARRACDGVGTCKPATTQSCAPYLCNGISACKAACTRRRRLPAARTSAIRRPTCAATSAASARRARRRPTASRATSASTASAAAASSCGLVPDLHVVGRPARARTSPRATPSRTPAAPRARPAATRATATARGACEQAGVGVALRRGLVRGLDVHARLALHGRGRLRDARRRRAARPTSAARARARPTCAGDGDCVAPFTCQGAGATQELRAQDERPRLRDGQPVHQRQLRRRRLLRLRELPGLPGLQRLGHGRVRARRGRHARARDVLRRPGRRRPAARTASATARAAARSTPTARRARPRPAPRARRRSRSPAPASGGTLQRADAVVRALLLQRRRRLPRRPAAATATARRGYYCTGAGGSCVPKKATGQRLRDRRPVRAPTTASTASAAARASCGSCQACNVAGSAGTCAPVARGQRRSERRLRRSTAPRPAARTASATARAAARSTPTARPCSTGELPASATTLNARRARARAARCIAGSQSCTPFLCTARRLRDHLQRRRRLRDRHLLHGPGRHVRREEDERRRLQPGGAQPVRLRPLRRRRLLRHGLRGRLRLVRARGLDAARARPSALGTPTRAASAPTWARAACSTNGLCDGAGACQSYAPTTVCSTASCPARHVDAHAGRDVRDGQLRR